MYGHIPFHKRGKGVANLFCSKFFVCTVQILSRVLILASYPGSFFNRSYRELQGVKPQAAALLVQTPEIIMLPSLIPRPCPFFWLLAVQKTRNKKAELTDHVSHIVQPTTCSTLSVDNSRFPLARYVW